MLLGLSAAAVAGLAAYVVIYLGSTLLQLGIATLAFGQEWTDPPVLGAAALYLVFGLPLSLILSVAVGLPVWKRAEARPLRSVRQAAALGATVGAAIGLLLVAFGFVMGLQTYFDDRSSFDSWSWGYQVTRDGLPTLLGWFFQLLSVLYFTLAGAIGGLAARWVALPKAKRQE